MIVTAQDGESWIVNRDLRCKVDDEGDSHNSCINAPRKVKTCWYEPGNRDTVYESNSPTEFGDAWLGGQIAGYIFGFFFFVGGTIILVVAATCEARPRYLDLVHLWETQPPPPKDAPTFHTSARVPGSIGAVPMAVPPPPSEPPQTGYTWNVT
mmetsp:Transcript_41711/g.98081  ORF Transcript_41711/g.98081 Transcript_41711/m.98081 type:complete len:153 (-) Transcript_41711:70-528(-)